MKTKIADNGLTVIPFQSTDNGLNSSILSRIIGERKGVRMFDTHELNRCRAADFSSCDTASLVDLRNIRIDADKPVPERVKDFMNQVGNPYLFKVGDIVVKVKYGNGKQLPDALASLFRAG